MDNYDKSDISRSFYNINEPYAAGFFEDPDRSLFFRYSHAQRVFWRNMKLPEYLGGRLYPSGCKYPDKYGMTPDYSFTFSYDAALLNKKGCGYIDLIRKEAEKLQTASTPHTVGGFGYTHSIPNYGRIIREGLDSYVLRIDKLPAGDFKDGLLEIVGGIKEYRDRAIALCKASGAPEELVSALSRVPFSPAKNLYEAVVSWNFIYYMDGCDNPGRLDNDLAYFYRGENIEDLLMEFFINVDKNDGWSAALGPDYNPLTLQCLKAIKGLRRPSLELRITDDTPEEIWEAAQAAVASGCGQPAFYNEKDYQRGLAERFPYIPSEDLLRINGGGCTETMLAGISNVGSLDAGINLVLILSAYMRKMLADCKDFNSFYSGLIKAVKEETAHTLDILNDFKVKRLEFRPQPVRTLLIDDCIDKGLDFNAGGARYYWSVINFAGLVNCIDSLNAIKYLIYDTKQYTPEEFIHLLDSEDSLLIAKLKACPCYGTDNDAADKLAAEFASDVFGALEQRRHVLGGEFLPSSIQFVTYADSGKGIPATPDGRRDSAPLADSIGAIHGKDRLGPTAMLKSASKLPLRKAVGTPVMNIRLQKDIIPKSLKQLVTGYFGDGGMQLQVSCVSREDILDAMEDPEKHENLIVRVGGYSEYFNRLSPEIKQSVLERTEFRCV